MGKRKYPPDRIRFFGTFRSAELDKEVFELFLSGKMDLVTACKSVAFNNRLPEVTPEQFLNELKICCWLNGGKNEN